MSDTGGFPLAFGSSQFAGKSNRTRVQGNAWGWENLGTAPMSAAFGYRNQVTAVGTIAGGSSSSNSGANSWVWGNGVSNIAANSGGGGISGSITGANAFGWGNSLTIAGTSSAGFGQSGSISASFAFGCGNRWVASRQGELAHSSGNILSSGDCQHGWLVALNQTTSNTPTVLYLDGVVASQRPVMATGARWGVTVEIVAATTGAINKSARFVRSFQIDRPTTAASTTLVGSVQTIGTDTGTNAGSPPAGWAVSITADTTNGAPQFQVTGDTDTINWTAAIHYVQTIRV